MVSPYLSCLVLIASRAIANIPVHYKVTLNCNGSSPAYTGCLRGMSCDDGETCTKPAVHIKADTSYFLLASNAFQKRQTEATIEPDPGATAAESQGGPVTIDGTCGAGNGGTVCGNFEKGSCCSLFGFCGDTAAHCGDGCQSGPCNGAPVTPAPGPAPAPLSQNPGSFLTVGQAGVPAMHAGLMQNSRVVFLDKIETFTQLKLANGRWAYSAEYDPATNTAVGLAYKTNAFCSGGVFLADGRFVSLGGNGPLTDIDPTLGDGFNAIRYLSRTSPGQTGSDWSEPGNKLASARWYASAQTMGDSTVFVASGSLNGLDPTVKENNNPTYEVLDAQGVSNGQNIPLDILEKNQPYYMYPFLHLLSDGNLLIFVSKSAIVFDVGGNQVIKTLVDIPGDYRTYPNTGGSVLLPLSEDNGWAPDVVICGGGAYQDITSPTDASCGRIRPLDENPQWEMDSMPEGRGMVEGVLLLDGSVLWINGCNQGAQGFGLATAPTLEALIYNPNLPKGRRWNRAASSSIARLYHSVAVLLLDGTVMVAGSNPVEQPILEPVPGQTPSEDFVTEFRVEIYTPPYLQGSPERPSNAQILDKQLAPGVAFTVSFTSVTSAKDVRVVLYHGGFVTHSLHMGHRMIYLPNSGFAPGQTEQTIVVTMPPNSNIVPPGPYVIYIVCDGVPSIGQFVSVTGG